MFTLKKNDFDYLINELAEVKFRNWLKRNDAIVNEPPLNLTVSKIDPKTETQVADTNLPISDREWKPGNKAELGMALKQLAQEVPDSQINWLYVRFKKLINDTLDNVDSARMQPRLDNDL